MRIHFIANPVAWGWSPWDKRLGGTEECIVEWSKRLSLRGHDVRVFNNGRHGDFQGVPYLDRLTYLDHAGNGVTVNVNYADLAPQEPTIHWTTLAENRRDLSDFKEVLCISEYAKNNTGIVHSNVSILSPGYDPLQIKPGNKIPRTVLYASSPDRGLNNLLKVWPDVVQQCRDAQLVVTYGAELGDTPNATCLGEVSSDEMNQLYAESDIWCHPANGGELYCMTGIRAQAARCWPVYFPAMALKETVRYGTPSSLQTLVTDLVRALQGHPEPPKGLRFPDWDSTTDQLEQVLRKYA